jgi:hypothetical protein
VAAATDQNETVGACFEDQREVIFIGIRQQHPISFDEVPPTAPLRLRARRYLPGRPHARQNRERVPAETKRKARFESRLRRIDAPVLELARSTGIAWPEECRMRDHRGAGMQVLRERHQPAGVIVVAVAQDDGVKGRGVKL